METRPNKRIEIGAVDLSCAFVVCDAKVHDNPIVYCSESFERMTGYTKYEIQGQNCRFLQSPDGKVEAGLPRKYCDDESVLYLKNCVTTRTEAQISLINYRKGGQPFMNLLTMIPILDDDGEIFQFVGLQVDLVENPHAVLARNNEGAYNMDYKRNPHLPAYHISPPDPAALMEHGQSIPRDEVSTLLTTLGTSENELSKRMIDKMILENSDDVIHVLSLKGLFLYLSPSCGKVLEYDPSELVGMALSAVCHPSDIVPVTRELKETQSGTSVTVVYRVRRKQSGYVWFESHGCLHTEQGKGRKCIILVGRTRPVYTLSKNIITTAGGIGDHEMWSKMSTTGMFLYVSDHVKGLLDKHADELIGTSIQAIMRPDSKAEFERVLALVLTGENAELRHEVINRRGQVLQAHTWLYPGDAEPGQKPTFIIAQTRLIKYNRPTARSTSQRDFGTEGSVGTAVSGRASQSTGIGTATPRPSEPTATKEKFRATSGVVVSRAGALATPLGEQNESLASDENAFDELKTTRSSSWQYELRQLERRNRILAEEVQQLLAAKKKRKRRRGAGMMQKDCANCHTTSTPEWRRGPSGNRDLCNSCGLRWAKQVIVPNIFKAFMTLLIRR
jgi:PAS domain S-box-containing protein